MQDVQIIEPLKLICFPLPLEVPQEPKKAPKTLMTLTTTRTKRNKINNHDEDDETKKTRERERDDPISMAMTTTKMTKTQE